MKLEQFSAAYAAYKLLDRMPKNAEGFTLLDNGWPLIQFGEHRCRMRLADGGLCDKSLAKQETLFNHVSKLHRIPIELRPKKAAGSHQYEELDKLDKFYKEMMRGEDIEGILKMMTPKPTSEDSDPGRMEGVLRSVATSGTPSMLQQDDGNQDELRNGENNSSVKQEVTTQEPASGIIHEPKKAMGGNDNGPDLQDDHARDATSDTNPKIGTSEAIVIDDDDDDDDDDEEQEMAFQIEEAETQEKLYAAQEKLHTAQLRKIQLKRKLAAMRKRRTL